MRPWIRWVSMVLAVSLLLAIHVLLNRSLPPDSRVLVPVDSIASGEGSKGLQSEMFPLTRTEVPGLAQPSRSDGGPASRHVIKVVGGQNEVVGGASVTLVSYDGTTLISEFASVEGEVRYSLPEKRTVLLAHVRADGYSAVTCDLPLPVPAEFCITLRPSGSIAGVVAKAGGGFAPEGTTVYAWSSVSISTAEFIRRQRNRYGLHVATTDASGRFVLQDIDSSIRHSFVAGFPGWIATEAVRPKIGDECRITVRPLYGCIVNAQMPDGSKPPMSIGAVVREIESSNQQVVSLSCPSIELAAAGISSSPLTMPYGYYDWRSICVAYAGTDDLAVLPGFGVEYSVPGFESRKFGLTLPRMLGEWKEARADIRPTCLGFGDLRVVLRRQDGDPRSFEGNIGLKIELVPKSDSSSAYAAPLVFARGVAEVPGVPIGVYEVRVTSELGWAFPASGRRQIDIVRGSQDFTVPANEFASACIAMTNHDSSKRSSTFIVKIDVGARSASGTYANGPMITLHGIRPGEHRFAIVAEADGKTEEVQSDVVSVIAGRMHLIDLQWGN